MQLIRFSIICLKKKQPQRIYFIKIVSSCLEVSCFVFLNTHPQKTLALKEALVQTSIIMAEGALS